MIRSRKDSAVDLQVPHALRPRLWQPELRPPPRISVLVPVRNEGRFIRDTLRQLLEQRYERFEVIVADGDSTDDTREQVRSLQQRFANLYLVPNPGRWSSAGRNAALQVARGDLIVVVDGHCDIGTPNYLSGLVDAFDRSGADCVGRPQPLDVSQASVLQRTIAACRACRLGHHPESFIYSTSEQFVRASSVAVAYRREVFNSLGTFDERFDACEDVEFNHRVDRAGLRCFFTPQVQVRYHPRGTLSGLFRQMVRYGRGRIRLARKHRDTISPAGLIPALFVCGLLLGPLLALFSHWLAAAYLGSLALYAMTVLLASVSVASKARDLRLLPFAPLVFPAIHVGAGTGMMLELLRPGKPPERTTTAVEFEPAVPRRAA